MIILTGAAGFIGTNILRKLNEDNINDIIVVDEINDSSKWKQLNGCKFIDYVNKESIFEYLEKNRDKIGGIIHMGACSSTTEKNFDFLYLNNVVYSQRLWKFCSRKEINFVYASSAATYGCGENGFDDTHDSIGLLNPINVYGYSKHLFDLWALKQEVKPAHWVGLKFFNVYGPFENFKGDMASVAHRGILQAYHDGFIKLFKSENNQYKDGEQKRDFIYIDDLVSAVIHFFKGKGKSGIYNIGTGKAQTFNEIGSAIIANCDVEAKIKYIEMPDKLVGSYQYFTEAKIEKLRSSGFNNEFSLANDGVKKMIEKFNF